MEVRELDLKVEIKKRAALVDRAIQKYLPISHPEELYKASRHLLDAGGKRVRPVMLMLAAEAVLGNSENVIPAAVAVELVHNFTLIHDDIMDEDELRRGIPAVHVKWDTSSAILAGDTLCCKAFQILAKSKAEPERIVASIDILSRALIEICEGQWLDLDFEKREIVSIKEYLEMVRKKTGMLFAASTSIGGLLAGGNKIQVDALYEIGLVTGIGFQIRDDVLDLIAPQEILGKPRGSDLIEKKKTLVAIHAQSKGIDLDQLAKLASQGEIEKAVEVLEKAGSIAYAMRKAKLMVEKGKQKLEVLPQSDAKKILAQLANYMITREY